MPDFTISRLETENGTFRLNGEVGNGGHGNFTLSCVEMLGTDGWVELNMQDDNVVSLITQISADIIKHLFTP